MPKKDVEGIPGGRAGAEERRGDERPAKERSWTREELNKRRNTKGKRKRKEIEEKRNTERSELEERREETKENRRAEDWNSRRKA